MALSKKARVSRKVFTSKYSRRTAAIIKLYALKRHLDWRSRQIDERLEVGNFRTVAATLANLTRGTYAPFVDVDIDDSVYGTCKY